jgi:hypothetical protein
VKALLLLATTVALLCSLMPARAQTIYPIQWCRVYDDTTLIQIPSQCGTVLPYYPRKLWVRSGRRLVVIYDRY